MKHKSSVNKSQADILRLTRVVSYDTVFAQNYNRIWGNLTADIDQEDDTSDPFDADVMAGWASQPSAVAGMDESINQAILSSLHGQTAAGRSLSLIDDSHFLKDETAQTVNFTAPSRRKKEKKKNTLPPPNEPPISAASGDDANHALSDLAAWGLDKLSGGSRSEKTDKSAKKTSGLSELEQNVTAQMRQMSADNAHGNAQLDPKLDDINLQSTHKHENTKADHSAPHADIVSVDNLLKNIAAEKQTQPARGSAAEHLPLTSNDPASMASESEAKPPKSGRWSGWFARKTPKASAATADNEPPSPDSAPPPAADNNTKPIDNAPQTREHHVLIDEIKGLLDGFSHEAKPASGDNAPAAPLPAQKTDNVSAEFADLQQKMQQSLSDR